MQYRGLWQTDAGAGQSPLSTPGQGIRRHKYGSKDGLHVALRRGEQGRKEGRWKRVPSCCEAARHAEISRHREELLECVIPFWLAKRSRIDWNVVVV